MNMNLIIMEIGLKELLKEKILQLKAMKLIK